MADDGNENAKPAPEMRLAVSVPAKPLSPEAMRALAEARARRQAESDAAKTAPAEIGGPKGPEPTRYGDWEIKGIVSDF